MVIKVPKLESRILGFQRCGQHYFSTMADGDGLHMWVKYSDNIQFKKKRTSDDKLIEL